MTWRRAGRGAGAFVCAALVALGAGAGPAGAAGPATGIAPVTSAGSATAAGAPAPPALSVSAATLIEASTGQRLYGVNPDRSQAIASTTKLMTALLTLEHVRNLDRSVSAPDYYPSPAESQIGLVPGERMSVHDLLLAMLLPSANDAAEDLAYNIGGHSVAHFVAMMNARARHLHLTATHYSTPVGLDTPGNYSSASDLVRLAEYDRSHFPFFARAVAERSAVLHTGSHPREVVNRDDLLGRYPWMNGVKSGHTIDAGYVLVGSATQHRMTLLSAVLGTSSEATRDSNTISLLEWGFANFRLATLVRAGAVLVRVPVRNQPGVPAKLIAASSVTRVISRSTHLRTRVLAPRQISGPKRWHAVVGSVIVIADGKPIARVHLLLAHALRAPIASHFITRPTTVLSALVLFGALTGLAVRRRWRTRHTVEQGATPA